MRTDNLRSPLAVGLLAAAAVTAVVLPTTAGQVAQQGPRVVSDANISLATCQTGPNGLTQFCFSQSTNSAGETITNFAMSGPVGNTATLVNTVTADSIMSVLTGPLGRTATFYYEAFYGTGETEPDITAYFRGPGGYTLIYSPTSPGGSAAVQATAASTQGKDAAKVAFGGQDWVGNLQLMLTNYSGASSDTTVQPQYPKTRSSLFSSRTTRSAATRADAGSGYQYKNYLNNPSASAVRSETPTANGIGRKPTANIILQNFQCDAQAPSTQGKAAIQTALGSAAASIPTTKPVAPARASRSAAASADISAQGSGDLSNINLLKSGYHLGIDTIGQTLKNANLQWHSEPPNPQLNTPPKTASRTTRSATAKG